MVRGDCGLFTYYAGSIKSAKGVPLRSEGVADK